MTGDDVDRALVHALQVDGRAPFRRIGEVLGVSDRTVARRYARLRAAGALRVVALRGPAVTAGTQWLLRVRAAPDVAVGIADALARRPDISWVSLCAGGTEILATLYGDGIDPLLLDVIPRTPHVRDVQADRVLHVFYGGAGEPFTKAGPLTAAQVASLAPPEPAGPPARLDATDRAMLALLHDDGRTSVDRLAAATGTSAVTVRRRLRELRASGALHLDVDVDTALLDLPLHTMLRWAVAPAELDAAGRALATHPEVAFAAATTGSTALFAAVVTADVAALYRYLTGPAVLPGAREVHSSPVLRTVKQARVASRTP